MFENFLLFISGENQIWVISKNTLKAVKLMQKKNSVLSVKITLLNRTRSWRNFVQRAVVIRTY